MDAQGEKSGRFRGRRSETRFIDVRKPGRVVGRTQRAFTDEWSARKRQSFKPEHIRTPGSASAMSAGSGHPSRPHSLRRTGSSAFRESRGPKWASAVFTPSLSLSRPRLESTSVPRDAGAATRALKPLNLPPADLSLDVSCGRINTGSAWFCRRSQEGRPNIRPLKHGAVPDRTGISAITTTSVYCEIEK